MAMPLGESWIFWKDFEKSFGLSQFLAINRTSWSVPDFIAPVLSMNAWL